MARSFLVIGWLFSCVPVGVNIVMCQHWPISLLAGPDTNYAREGFEKEVGFKAPSSVSKIYYRSVGWEDGMNYLRFQVTSPDVVQRIVADKKMTTVNELRMMTSSRHPKWWAEKRGIMGLECYSTIDGKYPPWYYLWYDPETGTVWYTKFDF